jgi:dihydroorotase
VPNAAEEIAIARNIILAKITGGRLHITHTSSAGSVELIRQAKQQGIKITADTTPHYLTLTEDAVLQFGTNAKVNPPLRTAHDVAVLIEALKEGVIDAIITDHAPHTMADKATTFALAGFGFSVFETALGSLLSLVHSKKVPLSTLIARMTIDPARIIGSRFGNLGTLETGAPADIAIFDPDSAWVVDPGSFVSKGKNTPYAGATLKGRVIATLAGGKLVYHDASMTVTAVKN